VSVARNVVQALALSQGALLTRAQTGGWLVNQQGGIFHTDDLERAAAMLSAKAKRSMVKRAEKFGVALPAWPVNRAKTVLTKPSGKSKKLQSKGSAS